MRTFPSTRARVLAGLLVVALTAHAAAAGPLGPSDFTGDIHGPRLQALTLSPGAADVSGADAPMSADLRVTDDLSGVTHVALTWTHPAQQLSQSVYASLHSGDSLDGQWQAHWSVPRYAPAGRYLLTISLSDRVGNIVHLYGDELAAGGFPTGFDISDANPDTTPPRVTSLRFTPGTVDARSGTARVEVEVGVDDAQAGQTWIFVGLAGPDGVQAPYGVTMEQVSGTPNSGLWKGSGEIPRYVRPGRWSAHITVRDRVANQQSYGPAELSGLSSGFDVLSEEDRTPPRILEASYSPLEVNVHDQDQVVDVRLRISDDLSGVRYVVTSAHDRTFGQVSTTNYHHRSSGTSRDSVFEMTMTVAKSSATGLRELSLFTSDEIGNSVNWWGPDFAAFGAPPAILVYNVPLPPDLLGVDPGDGSVLVRWGPPSDDRGAEITGYVVIAEPGGTRVEVGAGARAAFVDGLVNGQARTFTVLARNKAGLSDPSRAATAVPAVPGPGAGPPVPPTPGPGPGGAAPASGYWMLEADGAVHAFGDAPFMGRATVTAGGAPAVDIEPRPARDGYWVTDTAGRVRNFGAAPAFGPAPALLPGETVTSLSSTRSGRGYWLFTSRGRVMPFGDAAHLGDLARVRLNAPVLDSVPTPSGDGYYMVGGDGGVFTFGDARFAGSMAHKHLNAPVQSLVPNPGGSGYWLVASDGGIFAFGNARFHGSLGGTRLNRPVTGMVGSRTGAGYLMVGEDGGIFTFGDIAFRGSRGGAPGGGLVVAVAAV